MIRTPVILVQFAARLHIIVVLTIPLASQDAAAEQASRFPHRVDCEGTYPGHLQGICLDEQGNIYWSFTTWLVKTDPQGKLIHKVPVANHHGDLCYDEGKVYVAVNLGKFNDPQGNADSWVYVYKTANLKETARHEVQQVKFGAGGVAVHDNRFLVVGGLPGDREENDIHEFDQDFNYVKQHSLDSGQTYLGIQGATYSEDAWWFACYGQQLLTAKTDLEMLGRYTFECGLGIVGLGESQFYIARGKCQKEIGCTGHLLLAVPDEENGLRVLAPQTGQ